MNGQRNEKKYKAIERRAFVKVPAEGEAGPIVVLTTAEVCSEGLRYVVEVEESALRALIGDEPGFEEFVRDMHTLQGEMEAEWDEATARAQLEDARPYGVHRWSEIKMKADEGGVS